MAVNSVIYYYGSQSKYDALSVKDTNTLYFTSDTARIYKGDLLMSEQVSFTNSVPEFATAKDGLVYVVKQADGSVGIYVKGTDKIEQVGGGTVQAGAIENIDAFNDAVLTKADELVDGVLPEGDTTIPTSGAVKTAIEKAISEVTSTSLGLDGAYVDVVAETAPEGTNGTVLKFTTKAGETKSVTIADLFLTSASYDTDTHDLTLVVGSGESATSVVVPLDDLVPQAVNASQVAMAREITVTTTVGNLKAGDKVILSGDPATGEVKAADVQAMFEAILSKDINPTTTQPSASVTLTGAGAKEVGTSFTPSYTASLNAGKYSVSGQADQTSGVTATAYAISDTNSNSATTASGSFGSFTVEENTNYKVTATISYSDGNIPKTFLGNDYPDGQIKAGSKTATSSAVTGYRSWFMYVGTDTTTLTSSVIRGTTNKGNAKNASTQNSVTIPAGTKRVMVALPTSSGYTKRLKSVIDVDGMGLDVFGNFVQSTISVEGLNSYAGVDYIVYDFVNENGMAATKFNLIIG